MTAAWLASTRGNPTSAANGGGFGGPSSDGKSCSTISPTTPTAIPLPSPAQRIRICPTKPQVAGPTPFSPGDSRSSSCYASAVRNSSMSRIWSSTQSPGLRE
jgi:hypothetical protein